MHNRLQSATRKMLAPRNCSGFRGGMPRIREQQHPSTSSADAAADRRLPPTIGSGHPENNRPRAQVCESTERIRNLRDPLAPPGRGGPTPRSAGTASRIAAPKRPPPPRTPPPNPQETACGNSAPAPWVNTKSIFRIVAGECKNRLHPEQACAQQRLPSKCSELVWSS